MVGYQFDLLEVDIEIFDIVLFLMCEMVSELILDIEVIDCECGVIFFEVCFWDIFIQCWNSVFNWFCYFGILVVDWDLIGLFDVIEIVQCEQFVDYYENFYIFGCVMLVVIGDIDVVDVELCICECFVDWEQFQELCLDLQIGDVEQGCFFLVGYFYDLEVFMILMIDVVCLVMLCSDSCEVCFQNNFVGFGDMIFSCCFDMIVSLGVLFFLQVQVFYIMSFQIVDCVSVLVVFFFDCWEEGLVFVEQELCWVFEYGFIQVELDE